MTIRSPHHEDLAMLVEEMPVDVADLAVLGKLFEEHKPKLLAMVARRSDRSLRGRRDPDDVLEDAFVKAQDRWPEFLDSGLSAYSWLYRVVLDCLLDDRDYHTRQKRDVRAEVGYPDGSAAQLAIGLVSPLTSPSSALAREEYEQQLHQRMTQTLALLRPEDRDILCMRFLDELSAEEIAAVLDITAVTARQRYTRARLRFRDLWKKLFGQEGMGP